MRRAGGYAIIVDPGNPTIEMDTIDCKHCNAIIPVKPFQNPSDMGGFCTLCSGHMCRSCTALGGCDPFEKKLDRWEGTLKNNRVAVGGKR